MVTQKYLDACTTDGGLRGVMADTELPEVFGQAWRDYLLPRPLFCAEDRIRRAAADVAGLFDLMASLPDRLFGGDVRKYCAAIGADERRAELMLRFTDRPHLYGRADLHDDGANFRLLEFNVGSELGGVDLSEVNRALLATKPFAGFAAEHGLTHVDTPAAIAAQLAEATGKEAPVVATLEAIGGMPAYESLHRSFQETMSRYGVELVYGELDEVRVKGGRVYVQDRPIDLVLRYFSVNQLVGDPRNEEYAEAVMRAHEEGDVVLWTPLNSAMLALKSCLPLVSDPGFRADLSADENALIDRILPWTRTLTPELVDRVRAEREHMILKPFAGLSGRGIRVGWEQTDREWAETLAGCDDGYIVQRRVDPVPEPVMDPETGVVEDWRAVWGIFAFPAGYGGVFCRAVPPEAGSVVNLGSKGAKVTSAFHY
ncbi:MULTISPECIES: glutathionylspermidine synthase family protein [Thermomonosporaceae]|uniref:glutathionylspermidine synthase family protein n=1 Tax=Thermomonosporaceae TaxID=2012 RepID=UPI00255A9922|nr:MULTISPECIES: glutathionylspermidine synthase family protein [Thermomonosporaceae]MDL4773899.1 glutathionylspermidine synthase family protein [Actinomadura xylanilytica]